MRFLFFLFLLVLQLRPGSGEEVTIELFMPSAAQVKSTFKVEMGPGLSSMGFLALCLGSSLPLARALQNGGIDINEHQVEHVSIFDSKGSSIYWSKGNVQFFLSILYDIYDSMSFEKNKGKLPYSLLEIPPGLESFHSANSLFSSQEREREVEMNVLIASMFILSGISGMVFGLVLMDSRRKPAKEPEF